MQPCFYLFIFLQVAEGCILNNKEVNITKSSGESVVLSCSCDDPQNKAESFTWSYSKKNVYDSITIYPTKETNRYSSRVQRVNGNDPGNFTIIISHLTVEDTGDYQCQVKPKGFVLVHLTVTEQHGGSRTTPSNTPKPGSCILNDKEVNITKSSGESVVLSCSCDDPQNKAESFTWSYSKTNVYDSITIYPPDETNRYSSRVQRVNGNDPGNFTIIISHLTVEDTGDYKCEVKPRGFVNVHLTVTELLTRKPSPREQSTDILQSESLPFVPFAVVTVFFLHIIVAVVYYRTRKKDFSRVCYSTGDGKGSVTLD